MAWFGGLRLSTGSLPTDRLFTGQIRDLNDDRFYFFKSRYYDATIGKFHTPDSVVPGAGNPQALNRYAYAFNNPLRFVDPSGHDPMDPGWRDRWIAAHPGHTPSDQDWADYKFSLQHAGTGPNGNWTDANWQAFGAVENLLGSLLSEVGRSTDLGAALNTALGDLLAGNVRIAFGQPGPDGTLIMAGDSGPIPPNAVAITIGNDIFMRSSIAGDRALLVHEYVHVLQYRYLGISFLPAYYSMGLSNWDHNALEQQAIRTEQIYRANLWLPEPWYFPWAGGQSYGGQVP